MGRVSLTEDYDDRSVISKLNEMDKRVTENTTVVTSAEASAKASAQAAQETADRFAGSVGAVVQNANAQINASKAQVDQAKAEVDETVTTVAQAVQTANQASASAQQSATTVEGYDTRLTTAETKNSQQDTAISALQTADTQNVKINRVNEYAVGLTGNQTSIAGYKVFNKYIMHSESGNQYGFVDQRTDINITALTGTSYKNVLKVVDADNNNLAVLEVRGYANGTTTLFVKVRNSDGSTKTVKLAEGDVI